MDEQFNWYKKPTGTQRYTTLPCVQADQIYILIECKLMWLFFIFFYFYNFLLFFSVRLSLITVQLTRNMDVFSQPKNSECAAVDTGVECPSCYFIDGLYCGRYQ